MRRIIFMGLALVSLVLGSGEAMAQTSAQMLPPVGCPNTSTSAEQVYRGVLGWDGQSTMACIPGFTLDADGNMAVAGSAQVGFNSADCTDANKGAIRYNDEDGKKYPEYCDGTEWLPLGGGKPCKGGKVVWGNGIWHQGLGADLSYACKMIVSYTNGQPNNIMPPDGTYKHGQVFLFTVSGSSGIGASITKASATYLLQCVDGAWTHVGVTSATCDEPSASEHGGRGEDTEPGSMQGD